MSFISNPQAVGFDPGYFLASHEDVTRLTREISQTGASTAPNGGKYVPAGTVWPSNDGGAEGIVYENVDVSTGNMPGSVIVKGTVYEDRLPIAIDEAAKTALEAKGFVFISSAPAVERPY